MVTEISLQFFICTALLDDARHASAVYVHRVLLIMMCLQDFVFVLRKQSPHTLRILDLRTLCWVLH